MNKLLKVSRLAISDPELLRLTAREKRTEFLKRWERKHRNGLSSYPTKIALMVNEICNLKCHMCPFQRNDTGLYSKDRLYNELDIKVVKELLDEVAMHKPSFTITGGGEPFLYKNLFPVIKLIKNKGLYCRIFTNGTFLSDNIDKIIESKINFVAVSIDGPEETHDFIRGANGTFKKAIEGIRQLHIRKRQLGSNKPLTGISFSITKYSYAYLNDILDVAEELGVDVLNYNHLVYTTKDLINKTNRLLGLEDNVEKNFLLDSLIDSSDEIDVEELVRQIEKLKTRKTNVLLQWSPFVEFDKLDEYYRDSMYQIREICYAPWDKSRIYANGDVYSCHLYKIGNIYKDKFSDIWNNSRFLHFRRVMNKYGVLPACSKCCNLQFKKKKETPCKR